MIIKLAMIIAGIIAFLIYFAPSIIASNREHNNFMPIFIFNALAGWSLVVWIICLGWAFSDNVRR